MDNFDPKAGPCACSCHDAPSGTVHHVLPCCPYTYMSRDEAEDKVAEVRTKKGEAQPDVRYYPRTVEILTEIIEATYGPQAPERDKSNMPAHLCWMMQEMQAFPDSRKGSAKAGRWIGWIFAQMEIRGLITEARHLEALKADVESRYF